MKMMRENHFKNFKELLEQFVVPTNYDLKQTPGKIIYNTLS